MPSAADAADAADGWHALTDAQQLSLARAALRRAAEILAGQAELLAEEIESGALRDRGGPEALRLFAALVRATSRDACEAIGHA
ncbi:hypothetical protein K1J50_17435 [Caldovatus sp. SYSU G05006]|uniref:Uncharacterized protein n=1 Tax=Caldovatus aquaticus TaxID=2865671 RepID=A0ABS7F6M7_9PROT|nr:hypothetical protein [Caldovatus aquaticus]